jgi:hypothetical protein
VFHKLYIAGLCAGCSALLLSACASEPTRLANDESCYSLALDLNRLDRAGVQKLVARQNSGETLSPEDKAKAANYNRLFQRYLGARCHQTTSLLPTGQ